MVLQKRRHGDRDVDVAVPDVARWRDHTPVLVNDTISTARTMIETICHLKRGSMQPPISVAVHGIFAGSAFSDLVAARAGRVVTTNTVPHATNAINIITGLLAHGIRAVAG